MSQAQLLPTAAPSDSPFQFKSFPIRTQVEGNQLWFAAKDVCAALGIGWNGTTLSAIPDEWQSMRKFRTLRRGEQRIRSINEPAVYKLAFRSNKPEADAFTNWVASEVLPAIRKTGKYEVKPGKKTLGRGIKALSASNEKPIHLFDRLHLSPYEKLHMGSKIKQMLDEAGEVGPRTLECIILKARYASAIADVCRLGMSLSADLARLSGDIHSALVKRVNTNRTFTDPLMDTLGDSRHRIDQLGEEFRSVALRALNTNICLAKMLDM